jgi:hypothetical protein
MMRLSTAFPDITKKCVLIVLTIDPLESQFVNYYREEEELPFTMGVAEPSIVQGASRLGRIQGVPMTYLIDSSGAVLQQIAGVIEVDGILKLLERFFDR